MQDSKDIQDNGDMQGSKTVRWLEYKRRQMQRKILRKRRILISTLAPGLQLLAEMVSTTGAPSHLHSIRATAMCVSGLICRVQLVIDLNIEITFVLCIRFVCEIPCHGLALLDCEHFAKIEDRLLPVCIFGMGAGGEPNWFVAGGKVDVEPGDQSVNKVIPLATKAKGSREGEFSGCNCVEVDCENRTRVSN